MQHDIRSSDVFLKKDIESILRSLVYTVQVIGTAESGEFTRGYACALAAVAVALNIESDKRPATLPGSEW